MAYRPRDILKDYGKQLHSINCELKSMSADPETRLAKSNCERFRTYIEEEKTDRYIVIGLINLLPDTRKRRLLTLRYMSSESFEDIGARLFPYLPQYEQEEAALKLHREAINQLERAYYDRFPDKAQSGSGAACPTAHNANTEDTGK